MTALTRAEWEHVRAFFDKLYAEDRYDSEVSELYDTLTDREQSAVRRMIEALPVPNWFHWHREFKPTTSR